MKCVKCGNEADDDKTICWNCKRGIMLKMAAKEQYMKLTFLDYMRREGFSDEKIALWLVQGTYRKPKTQWPTMDKWFKEIMK